MNCLLPEKFEERMKSLLGEEYETFKKSILCEENSRGLRVNTKKISIDDFQKISPYEIKKIPYNSDGFYLLDNVQMGGEAYHQAGMFYMQEPSAMIPINSINIQPEWRVLDLCAAPGGKTAQISNALSCKGLLISNDIKYDRCKAMVDNIHRLGLDNVIVTSGTAFDICKNFVDFFDMVLVDATCSGEGMFRKSPNIITYWSPKKIASCVAIQKELLTAVVPTIKCGGFLIYSTCTFSVEENEGIVDWFLRNNPDYELCDVLEDVRKYTCNGVKINDDFPFEKTRRFYPHKGIGEGQFVALMRKKEERFTTITSNISKLDENSEKNGKKYKKEKVVVSSNKEEIVLRFLHQMGICSLDSQIYIKGDFAWISPSSALVGNKSIIKKHVVEFGVKIGEFLGNEFLPYHSFFTTFGKQINNYLDFSSDDAHLTKYLRGETQNYSCPEGYGVILVNGCAIGGYKSAKGKLISLYPSWLTNKDIFD